MEDVFVPPRECWAEGMLTNCSGGAPGQGCHMGFAAPTGMVRAGLRKRFSQLEVAEPESHSNLRAQGPSEAASVKESGSVGLRSSTVF